MQHPSQGSGGGSADLRRREGRPHGPLVRHARLHAGRFALTDAPEFPFMGDTAEATAVAYQRIYERMLARRTSTGTSSCFRCSPRPGQMYNTKRAISALKDLDGLKIRVAAAW